MGCIPKRVAENAESGMGKRRLASGNVQHGQIPMYIGTRETRIGMRRRSWPSMGLAGVVTYNPTTTIDVFANYGADSEIV